MGGQNPPGQTLRYRERDGSQGNLGHFNAPSTGLVAVSAADRLLSSSVSPPTTAPNTPLDCSSWRARRTRWKPEVHQTSAQTGVPVSPLTLLPALDIRVWSRNRSVRSTDFLTLLGWLPMAGAESHRHSKAVGRDTSTNSRWSLTVSWWRQYA